ncbi:hypothetical protein QJS04_geneDACA003196 [Acorus gramineus]|uniref:Wound-responsive family protein n=1 Tax=Acorus gramineus TaxID=55184 RepID=A0AAV9BVM8_ACOGR|nr:hypothetical protein QJS04_geneDACA003196 [Acorus gramineus]
MGRRDGDDKMRRSEDSLRKMSSTSRAWIRAASLGTVEALKDQGICRWNYTFRSLQQHAMKNIRSYYQATVSSSSTSSAAVMGRREGDEKMRRSEESLRKVMYLSCWGPN